MEKGATSAGQKPEEVVPKGENEQGGKAGDDDENNIDIAEKMKEMNMTWEDVFPPEETSWDKELPEDKKLLTYTFKEIKSEPIEVPNNLAEPIRKVVDKFLKEHIPVQHHARARASVEYLFRVCPLDNDNKERYESMAIFEAWFSWFDEYLVETNSVDECKRWLELWRDIDWNELLWDQERKDTPAENCFDVVWKRFQKAANEDQRSHLAKSMELLTEQIQEEIEHTEKVQYRQEDKFIEYRWNRLNFDIQWIVIDVCLGLNWEGMFFHSDRHKPLRRRGERFLVFLHDLYFFEQDYARQRGKFNILGMLRYARDFITEPIRMKGVIEMVQDRLEYYEWELNEQIKEYFSEDDDNYRDYNRCVRRFITESVNYWSKINKIDP